MRQEKAATHYFPEDRRPDPEVLLLVSPWISELFEPEVWATLPIQQKRKILSATNADCRESAYEAFLQQNSLLSRMILGLNGNGNGNGHDKGAV